MITHRLSGLSLGLALTLGIAAPALAQDQDQNRVQEQKQDPDLDQLRLRLRAQIHQDLGLTEDQLKELDPDLEQYLRLRGDGEHLRATLREAKQLNCLGPCMGETVRAMNGR